MPEWGKAQYDAYYRSGAERWGHPNTRPQITLGYHWFNILSFQAGQSHHGIVPARDFAGDLISVLGLTSGQTIVLVGCGFNATGAGLQARGINVVGTEVSSYIDAQRGQTEEAELRAAIVAAGLNPDSDTVWGPPGNVRVNPLDLFLEGGRAAPKARGKGTIVIEGMTSRPSRNSVKNAAGSARYVVTEEVINSIPDAEALAVCEACQRFVSENGGTVVHMVRPFAAGSSMHAGLNWKTYGAWKTFLTVNGFPLHRIIPTVDAADQGVTMPITGTPGTVIAYSGLI